MSKHFTDIHSPAVIEWGSRMVNGRLASPDTIRRTVSKLNAVATYHKRLIFCRSQQINNIEAGGGSGLSYWSHYWRTSEGTAGVAYQLGFVDTDYVSASNPLVELTVSLASDGSTVFNDNTYYNGREEPSSPVFVFNRFHHSRVLVPLSPNTEYYAEFSPAGGARLVYVVMYEYAIALADDSLTGVESPSKFFVESPIYANDISAVVDQGIDLWRHNGAHLLSWCSDYDPTASPVISSASYINVVDNSSTSITSATPGVRIQTTYHGTSSRPNAVPVKMAVRAERVTGSGELSVRISDGTNHVEKTGITTGGVGGWYTIESSMPGQSAKYDIQAKVTSGTFRVYAVCLWEHEEGDVLAGVDGPDSVYVPESAADFAALDISTPDSLWLFQEGSGDIIDQIGSQDLAANGSPTYQQSVTNWDRYGVGFSDGDSSYRFSRTMYTIGATDSYAALYYIRITNSTAARRFVLLSGTSNYIGCSSAGVLTAVMTNSNTSVNTYEDSTVHPLLLVLDRSRNKCALYTDLEKISIAYDATSYASSTKGIGASGSTTPSMNCVLGAIWHGSNAEGIGYNTLEKLGWTLGYATDESNPAPTAGVLASVPRINIHNLVRTLPGPGIRKTP